MIRIQNRFQEGEVTREVPAWGWERQKAAAAGGGSSAAPREGGGNTGVCGEERLELLEEHVLAIYVNEVLTMRVVCTAQNLAELTLGRLLSEGVIRSAGDVEHLYICSQGLRAKVFLSRERDLQMQDSGEEQDLQMQDAGEEQDLRMQDAGEKQDLHLQYGQVHRSAGISKKDPFVDVTSSCCTDNRTFHEDFVQEREPEPLPPGNWSADQVYGIAKTFFSEDTPLHLRTGSTHSCFLLRGEEILFSAEDIGRHNALDKVIGWALLQGVNLRETAAFTSGRVPADVVRKVIRAGIPVLISKEMPTRDAVKMAADMRLTLIGKARENSFILFA